MIDLISVDPRDKSVDCTGSGERSFCARPGYFIYGLISVLLLLKMYKSSAQSIL